MFRSSVVGVNGVARADARVWVARAIGKGADWGAAVSWAWTRTLVLWQWASMVAMRLAINSMNLEIRSYSVTIWQFPFCLTAKR